MVRGRCFYNNALFAGRERDEKATDYQQLQGESLTEGGNRELKEEIGYGVREWHDLSDFTLSSNYMTRRIHVLLARNLYEEKLDGDEPEPLEIEIFAFNQLLELCTRPDFTEARVIAALFLVREKLQNGWLR